MLVNVLCVCNAQRGQKNVSGTIDLDLCLVINRISMPCQMSHWQILLFQCSLFILLIDICSLLFVDLSSKALDVSKYPDVTAGHRKTDRNYVSEG